ncbi:YbaB/EbfC family nucleoid-associated protein [Nonomuraea recticatena]
MHEVDLTPSSDPYGGVVAHGQAADGMVRVTVSISGGADAVAFDPRVMRLPAPLLAKHVCHAMQAAHRELLKLIAGKARASANDLQRQIEQIHVDHINQMEYFRSVLDRIQSRVRD